MMELDFATLPDAQELQQVLQSHLPIGKVTVKDAQEFLRQQNLQCSEEIKREGDRYFDAILKTLKYSNQSTLQFDSCIGCKIPIKPNRISTRNPLVLFKTFLDSRLVTWDYRVRFYFEQGILVEIFTEKVGTGL